MGINLKTYSTEIITAIFMFLILYLGLTIARINFNIQMKAFQSVLKQQELIDENASYTRLLIKYINQKGVYQGTLDQNQLDRAEFEYKQNSMPQLAEGENTMKATIVEKPVILLINALRKITGNPSVVLSEDKNMNPVALYHAYYFENIKSYSNAIVIYNSFLSNNLNNNFRANIMLHTGFCYALTEDYAAARARYKQIISEYADSSIAVAAALLLRYMELFISERQKILNSKADNLTKGEKLSILLNHKSALKVMEDYKPTTKEEKSKLEYFKGVCYEETGEKQKAVDSFVKSIEADNNSQAAKYANRRVYSIATEMPENKKILETSIKLGAQQKDTVLLEIDKIYQEKVAETNTKLSNNLDTAVILGALASIESNAKAASDQMEDRQKAARDKEKIISRLIGKEVEITTISNENISGTLKTPETADFIIIETVIGNVGIDRKKVKSINLSK